MARKKRERSCFGLYHVMLRGINKQEIFFHHEDFVRMMTILRDTPFNIDRSSGKIVSDNKCTIFAYCILHNHLHILIREEEQSLSDTIKIIEDKYAIYYNLKYERVGHLFQGRFASEAINDENYFWTVFRYIARNPVKAMESLTAEAYPYSSWNEYTNHKSNVIKVIKQSAINFILDKYPLNELSSWIDENNEDSCLDMDDFLRIKSDKEAWDILSEITGYSNPEEFRLLDAETQIYYLLEAIDHRVSISQASRLGTISRYIVEKAYNKKHQNVGERLKLGSDPDLKNPLENQLDGLHQKVSQIQGYSKQNKNKLHKIIDYVFEHNVNMKCADIASFLGVCNEAARKLLVVLANENIVEISKKGKYTTYSMKMGSSI